MYLYDHPSPCSVITKYLFNSIKIIFQALIWNFSSMFVMVSFNCQSDTIYSNLGGDSMKEGCLDLFGLCAFLLGVVLITLLEVGKPTHSGWHHSLGRRF